tara:strand:- start:6348 stop:6812 length:465 start_codon:yes stop_codon:yes gene_type:complete
MAESIVQKILSVAVARLKSTEGCVGVYRPTKQGDFPVEDKVIVVTHEDIERDEELSCAGNPPKIAWVLPVRIAAVIEPDDDDENPIDERMNDFIVGAMNAITLNNSWYQFDGNAINSNLEPPLQFQPSDDTARGMSFLVRITYRVEETNQTQLA